MSLLAVLVTILAISCKAAAPKDFVEVIGGTVNGGTAYASGDNDYIFITGRNVKINDFYACDHEVTQAEYETYCLESIKTHGRGANYPAYYVSWYDALVYCNRRSLAEGLTPCYTINGSTKPNDWGTVPTEQKDKIWDSAVCNFGANGYRLPTEVEWEFLARSGNVMREVQSEFAGSDSIDDVAWYCNNSGDTTHEVKMKASNALGLFDMSGNVWEWCWDWYGGIDISTANSGVSSGSFRVCRGGSWYNSASSASVSYRGSGYPYFRHFNLGFRVVRSSLSN